MSAWLRTIAAETMEVIGHGGYTSPSGVWVDISQDASRSVAGTRLYRPHDDLSQPAEPITVERPSIEVTTESTLAAGRRLGPGTVALVFASARKPGGGFLNGVRSQEEDIARASALHACLTAVPQFYTYQRSHDDLRYSDHIIYSPDVPVFRDDNGSLLDEAYRLSFITSAAPNLGAIAVNQPHLTDSVPGVIATRAERILHIAAAHQHRTLVLGAWGCGVFANRPSVVAAAFAVALTRVPRFERVVFAILDPTGRGPTYRTFAEALAV